MTILATNYISGKCEIGEGPRFISSDPAKADIIGEGREASLAQIDQAVQAARRAFCIWSNAPRAKRIECVLAFKTALENRREVLATLISRENGKPLWEAATEVASMIGKVAISIEAYEQRTGDNTIAEVQGNRILNHRPHGVIAVLGPFNFPGHLANGHIVPAILAGNCIVFKPSELTPLVGQMMVEAWHEVGHEAGLCDGVINLVHGGANVGKALTSHNDIDGVFFTGSYQTGVVLHRQFAGQLSKILALELGGNNPLIVDDVSDIDAAALMITQSAYATSGQRCSCARRLIVPSGVKGDDLINKVIELSDKLIVGTYDDQPVPFMGPVINNAAADHIMKATSDLVRLGAGALRALLRPEPNKPFLRPALIDVTKIDAPDEEIFGPVLQLTRVKDFDEAIKCANATRFGLAAGLICDDEAKFNRFYQQSRAGIVNWNKVLPGASSAAPFGGIGDSGNHRPSAYYAADYCAYPVASMTAKRIEPFGALPQGFVK